MRKIIALALLLIPQSAIATIYTVTTNAQLTTANASMVAGDVAIISPGTYTVNIAPANAGTSPTNRITYVGSLDNPYSVTVPTANVNKSYVSIKGVSFTTLSSFSSQFDSVYACVGTNTSMVFPQASKYHVISTCNLTMDSFNADQNGGVANTSPQAVLSGLRFDNCLFTINSVSGNVPAFRIAATESLTINMCRINITIAPTGNHGEIKIYHTRHMNILDSRFVVINNRTTACDECGLCYIRDSTQYCKWTRDTLNFSGISTAAYNTFQFSNGGSFNASTSDNKWDQCVFTTKKSVTLDALTYWQNSARSDTLINSLLVGADGSSAYTNFNQQSSNPANIIKNNTIVGLGATIGAGGDGNATDTNTVYNNIIYSSGEHVIGPSGWHGNYDMGYSPLYDSTNCVSRSGTWGAFGSQITQYNASNICNIFQQECQGFYANPGFASPNATDPEQFDGRLASPNSPAFTCGKDGSRVGAYGLAGVRYYWVAPDNRGGIYTNTGADSLNPITLAAANKLAKTGCTFILLGGDYTANASTYVPLSAPPSGATLVDIGKNICPLGANGASQPMSDSLSVLKFISLWYYKVLHGGVVAAPDTNSYRVNSIMLARSGVIVSGITCDSLRVFSGPRNGNSECAGQPTLSGASGYCWLADSDSITWCKAKTFGIYGSQNTWINNCWFISPLIAANSNSVIYRNTVIGPYNSINNALGGYNITFADCYLRAFIDYGQCALMLGGGTDNIDFRRCTMIFDMKSSAQANDSLSAIQFRNTSGDSLAYCHIKVNATNCETDPLGLGPDSTIAYAMQFLNGSQGHRFIGDTLDLGIRPYSAVPVISAGVGTLSDTLGIRGMLWQDCIIRGDYGIRARTRLRMWAWIRCVFGCKRYSPLNLTNNNDDANSDSLSIIRCTMFADSSTGPVQQPALQLLLKANVNFVMLHDNIFFRQRTNANPISTNYNSGAVVRYGDCMGFNKQGYVDQNLYWSFSDSIQNAIYAPNFLRTGIIGVCNDVVGYPSGVVPCFSTLRSVGRDQGSAWGNPAFSQTTIDSSFDGRLACQNVTHAYDVRADSAVGATQPAVGVFPGKATQVDTIFATSTSLMVDFIGPPNDRVTGAGTPSGYYVVYSTTPDITQGNFITKPFVIAPGVYPGTLASKQITGLANNTIYYFAIVASAQCGITGDISDIQCGATRKANGTSSTQICRGN